MLLDFQLAKLYGVETRVLKQAVRRNIERFPVDFMFRLTKDEINILISNRGSQSVIPSDYNFGGTLRGRTEYTEEISQKQIHLPRIEIYHQITEI